MDQPKFIKNTQSLKADEGAIRAWVRRKTLEEPDRGPQSLEERDDGLTLSMDQRHIARFVYPEGRWRLQWFENAGEWNWADDKDYLTPAIPILPVAEAGGRLVPVLTFTRLRV